VAPTVVSEQLELIPELECREESEYLVITRRLHAVREALASRYPNRVTVVDSSLTVTSGTGAIIIGTPDAWLSRHAMLEAKREGAVLVLDSCSVSELRSLRVRPGLFPHVDPGKILVMEPDGTVSREKFKY
jgi:hypothetical protein